MSKNTTKLPLFAKSASEMFNIFEESIVINRKLAHEKSNYPFFPIHNLHPGIIHTFICLRHTSQNPGKIKIFKIYTIEIFKIPRCGRAQATRKDSRQKARKRL